MQTQITAPIPLLNDAGELTQPGYAKSLLPVYRRAHVKASPLRLKEWDYYLIANDRFAVALTIADNGYMGLDSISFLHFDQVWEQTKSVMRWFPMGRTSLPETSASGDSTITGKNYALSFRHENGGRVLTFRMDDFRDGQPISGRITLTDEPPESMVIATPFAKPRRFYYNQKINCMAASGVVTLGGQTYTFDPADTSAVLDWGRGVWTYHNTWYWGSGRRPLRLEHRLRLWRHLRRLREYALLRRQGPQAQPGHLPHPHEKRPGGLPLPLDVLL